jgi:tripartite-type tricarboxylate transporter receptor subunit TctC
MKTKFFIAAAGACVMLALAPITHAQNFPNKPVRLVDPYAPGGSTSVVSQLLSKKFQEFSDQPMVIDYKPGAGSNIGSDIVAKATPDGYTVLIGTSSLAINPHLYRSMQFDPIKDLTPIAQLIRTPNVLAVNPALPVRTTAELIAYARANPGKLNYGSSGNGATNHMAMELFKTLAKVDIQHVPFKGGSEALAALLGGQIQVLFNPASTLAPQDKTGRLRMIAIASTERVKDLNLPTVAESGLPGFKSEVWFGLFAPAGTPAPVIARLNALTNRILKDPSVAEVLDKAGMEPVGGNVEDLGKLLQTDSARWAEVVKATGAKIQ